MRSRNEMRRTVADHADDPSRAALSFVEREDGSVLAVWNRNHRCWGLPGGKLEQGEPMHLAAQRELEEETGIFAPLRGPIYRAPTFSGSGRICYVFESAGATGRPTVEETGTAVGWMTRDFLMSDQKSGAWFREFFAWLDEE